MNRQSIWQRFGAFFVAVFAMSLVFSTQASAATCDKYVLNYPAWYNGLQCSDGAVEIDDINQVWIIALNLVQWIMVTAGYWALVMIIWSGFQYIIAQGNSSKIEAAKTTLLHAVIGLVIVLSSVMIIVTIQGAIEGKLI